MATINLSDGNTYTFAKVNGKATILDSSDNAHAKKTLRNGLEVTGSVKIDAPNTSDGIRLYSGGDITHAIYSTGPSNTGYIQTYAANGELANILDDDGLLVKVNSDVQGSINIGDSNTTTQPCILNIGGSRNGIGYAYIDLVGDTTHTDFGLRLLRGNTGANTNSQLIHKGTGELQIKTPEGGTLHFDLGNNGESKFEGNTAGPLLRIINDGNNTSRGGLVIQNGNDLNTGTNTHLEFKDGDGDTVGEITSTNGAVSYGNFTGVHKAFILQSDNPTASIHITSDTDDGFYPIGTILCHVTSDLTHPTDPSKLCVQPQHYVVSSSIYEDSRVFGVYLASDSIYNNTNLHRIASIGDGVILVCSENGNITTGDYITTSSGSGGYGCKQSDDLLHNYTVAKSLESVDWSTEPENTKLVACTYHCG